MTHWRSLRGKERGVRTRFAWALAALALCPGLTRALAGQEIPSPEYVTYLPRGTMRAIGQTSASAQFQLFGDQAAPDYVDQSPRNGIDDRRDALFAVLGQQSAPWMVRNTYGFPTDIGRLIREHGVPLIHDRFDLARSEPVRLSSDTIRLDQGPAAGDDDRLRTLLERFGPQATPTPSPITPDAEGREVLYLEFPGEDPKSWAKEYGGKDGFKVSERYLGYAKTYMHPFIVEVAPDADGAPRYEFVLQYWFYYPTNDAGNVHEGDFEHLNVFLAPLSAVGQPLDASTVTAVLEQRIDPAELVPRKIEYYFHHWVFPVDFSVPNAYQSRAEWEKEVAGLRPPRAGARILWEQIRARAWLDDDETVINRHPLVMIGGDGRGLNLLLRPPGALGLSSHGSYPFAGLYKAVGPAGTGESVNHPSNMQRKAPAADAPETEVMIRYDNPARVEVLPDWERLAPLAAAEAEVRRTWAWFLLPAYLGYPASVSPLAGIVRFADTGNVPPGPPCYNGGWNRIGDGAGYADYLPHRLSSFTPLDVQDTYSARWGYLNATLPTWALLPPLDLLARLVVRPVSRVVTEDHPMFVRSQNLPPRRIGIGVGISRFQPASEFWRLIGLPELAGPLIQYANAITGTPFQGYGFSEAQFDPLVAWRGEISLHLGKRFVTTNALSHGRSMLHQTLVFADFPNQPLRASLNFWEYTGSLRLNIRTHRIQPFLDLGYGLSWYRLEHLTVSGTDLGSSRWIRKPGFVENVLPNTWHFGGGLEVLPTYGFGKINLGLKAAAGLYFHDLGLSTGTAQTVFFQNTNIRRVRIDLTGTVAY